MAHKRAWDTPRMSTRNSARGIAVCFFGLVHGVSSAQIALSHLKDEERAAIHEHVYGGLPATDNVYLRRGYVLGYNATTRTPAWVAYHLIPEFRQTPARDGRFSSFRSDPDIAGEPSDDEYRGLMDERGYARGHLAPYAAMGGDRDNDGLRAEYHEGDSGNVGDVDDAMTIFEANYMSNVAPQHQEGFNSGARVDGRFTPGLWYELERWIQDDLVLKRGREAWVFAGCVFGPGEHEKVGPNRDIWVPPMFYMIVVYEEPGRSEPAILAYLLPHQRVRHGELDAFLTSVDTIEALTGLDFFQDLDIQAELRIEALDTYLDAPSKPK